MLSIFLGPDRRRLVPRKRTVEEERELSEFGLPVKKWQRRRRSSSLLGVLRAQIKTLRLHCFGPGMQRASYYMVGSSTAGWLALLAAAAVDEAATAG